ncbi:MAG: hypothetical protein IT290_07720 [Deltaproteobacteria bacterium]|nr:hypothetical protein [Deltaproteobacteria bacterium]
MIIEARAYLFRALQSDQFRRALGRIVEVDFAEPFVLSELELDVERCPYPEEGLLATSVAFPLSQRLGRQYRVKSIVPARIAEALAEVFREEQVFAPRPGELGHLNFSPSPRALREFLRSIIESSGTKLSDESTMFAAPLPESSKRAFVFDWERFIGKQFDRNDVDVQRLRSALRSNLVLPRDVGLMLLGLAADSELCTDAFLQDVQGREHIPWFLRHTLQQINGMQARVSQMTEAHRVVALDALLRDGGLRWDSRDRYAPIVSQLLELRENHRMALWLHRPELSLQAALALLRSFRSLYDRPESRLSPLESSNESAIVVHAVSPAIALFAENVLRTLDGLPEPS